MPVVQVLCSHCSRSYSLDSGLSGSRARCKGCGGVFVIAPSADGGDAGDLATSAPSSSPAGASTIRKRIGRFEIYERLGVGGFGAVYRAYDPVLAREVALKVPHAGSLQTKSEVKRFLREAKAAAGLHHPHIVPVFDSGTDGPHHFIASAFIPGQTLAEAIAAGEIGSSRAARIIQQLADALHYAHKHGVVHRDVKPLNVMIDAEGEPHVMDFGLAHLAGSSEKLTQDSAILGTPAYMAPEQARWSNDATASSDQYSLGVALYELLCGQTPFSGPPHIVIFNTIHREPPPPRTVRAGISRDLETICLKAMAKRPEGRYASCAELADDLRRWLNHEPIRGRRVGTAERLGRWSRRNPATASLIIACVALMALLTTTTTVAYLRTSSALRLADTQRRAADEQRGLAVEQRNEANRNLYHALVGEARALRAGRVEGYRGLAWEKLEQARRLDTPDRDLAALRHEFVACMGDFVGLGPAVLKDFPAPISSAGVGPEGHDVAVGLADGTVEVRLAGSGSVLGRWKSREIPVTALGFAADGKSLVVGYQDGMAQTLDHTGGGAWAEVQPPVPGDRVFRVVMSPGGGPFVCSVGPNRLSVRDPSEGRVTVLDWRGDRTPECLAVSADGRLAAAGSRFIGGSAAESATVWDVGTKEVLRTVDLGMGGLFSLDLSPDGMLLAGGSHGGLKLYQTGTFRQELKTVHPSLSCLRFVPNSPLLAVVDTARMTRLILVAGNGEVAALSHPDRTGVLTLETSPDGHALAIVGPRTVLVWSMRRTPERLTLAGHVGSLSGLAFSPDGTRLASTSNGEGLRLWDLKEGRRVPARDWPGQGLEGVAFSPDGRRIAVGRWGGPLRLLDASTGEGQANDPALGWTLATAFSARGDLVAGGYNGVAAWRLGPGNPPGGASLHKTLQFHHRPCYSVAVSPDGRRIALIDVDGRIVIRDIGRGADLPFRGPPAIDEWHNLVFTPDEKFLLYVARSGAVVAWDCDASRVAYQVGEAGTFSGPCSVSADGRLLAAPVTATTLAVWDLGRRQHLLTLPPERASIWGQAWSADGRQLAVGTTEGGVSVWDIEAVLGRLDALKLAEAE